MEQPMAINSYNFIVITDRDNLMSCRERPARPVLTVPSPRSHRMFLFIFSYNCSFVLGTVRSSLIFSRPFALRYRCTGLEMFVPNILPRLWEYRYLSLYFYFWNSFTHLLLKFTWKIRRNLLKGKILSFSVIVPKSLTWNYETNTLKVFVFHNNFRNLHKLQLWSVTFLNL